MIDIKLYKYTYELNKKHKLKLNELKNLYNKNILTKKEYIYHFHLLMNLINFNNKLLLNINNFKK